LSDEELSIIAERVTLRRYDSGAIVFSEGDVCAELLIVKEGSVKILKTAANGRRQLIAIERRATLWPRYSVFDGGVYPATAVTVSPVVLLSLEAGHFRRICLRHPEVALKVIQGPGSSPEAHGQPGGRPVILDGPREAAGLPGPHGHRGRQAKRLPELSFNSPRTTKNWPHVWAPCANVVSRNLGRLHGEGLIEIRRRTVIVPSLASLKEELRSI